MPSYLYIYSVLSEAVTSIHPLEFSACHVLASKTCPDSRERNTSSFPRVSAIKPRFSASCNFTKLLSLKFPVLGKVSKVDIFLCKKMLAEIFLSIGKMHWGFVFFFF